MGFQDLILPAAELAASISIASAISWLFYTRFYLPVPPNRALVLYGHRAASPHTEPGRRVVSSDPERYATLTSSSAAGSLSLPGTAGSVTSLSTSWTWILRFDR